MTLHQSSTTDSRACRVSLVGTPPTLVFRSTTSRSMSLRGRDRVTPAPMDRTASSMEATNLPRSPLNSEGCSGGALPHSGCSRNVGSYTAVNSLEKQSSSRPPISPDSRDASLPLERSTAEPSSTLRRNHRALPRSLPLSPPFTYSSVRPVPGSQVPSSSRTSRG